MAPQVVEPVVVRLETASVVPKGVEQHPRECLFPWPQVRVAGCIRAYKHGVSRSPLGIIDVDEGSHTTQELLLLRMRTVVVGSLEHGLKTREALNQLRLAEVARPRVPG
ncbi:hypothetical protein D3C73_1384610 [compost metagenome]